jgi:hypothetical protein
MDDDDNKRLLGALKTHRPQVVRFTVEDGKQQRLAIKARPGAKRVEWSTVVRTLGEYDWTLIELLGKGDEVLGVVSASEEAANDNEDESHVERVLRLASDFADRAVIRHVEALQPTLKAMEVQVGMLVEQLVSERRDAAKQTAATAQLAEQLAGMAKKVKDGGEDSGELMGLLTQLPKLLPMVSMFFDAAGPPKPTKPANGANGAAKRVITIPPAEGTSS